MKLCPRCDEIKPLDEFIRNKGSVNGRGSYCRPCANAYRKLQIARDPEAARVYVRKWQTEINPESFKCSKRKWRLRASYGLSVEEYDVMLLQQGGGCAICCRPPDDNYSGLLYVDHDHDSGNVRGLLCQRCNFGIGLLGNNTDLLTKAAEYVAQHEIKEEVV